MQPEIKIFWKQSFGNTAIEFGGNPFIPIQTRRYDCQHGNHYYKKRERKSTRLYLQSTRKIGCPAHMVVKEYHLYPEYRLTENEASLKVHEVRELKKQRHTKIAQALRDEKPKKIEHRYFVFLPTNEAHQKSHPTGNASGMSQRVHPIISQKIEELVKEGITELPEVKRGVQLDAYYQQAVTELKSSPKW